MAIGERFKSINAPTLKSNSAIKSKRKPKATGSKPKATGTKSKATGSKPKATKNLTAAEKDLKAKRAKVTNSRLKGKKKRTLKERFDERIAAHGQRIKDMQEANIKRKAAYEKRHKVQGENLLARQKAQLTNLQRKFQSRLTAAKKSKPKMDRKANKIVVNRVKPKDIKVAKPRIKPLPPVRVTKGATKRRKTKPGAAKDAAKSRAKNKNKGTAEA